MNDYIIELSDDGIDELSYMIPDGFEESLKGLSEAEANRKYEKLKLWICDVEKFIKMNDCKAITNPIFFAAVGTPTPDGLLSNDIFGITKESRAGIWAYIDLKDWFIDPSCYKQWCKIMPQIKSIVHRTDKYIIDDNGNLIKDENGKNGVKFLKDNFDKLNFKKNGSIKREVIIRYLKKNKDIMFIKKYLVIPAYYRDMNTNASGKTNVGAINKLYAGLISTCNSLESTKDMGFDNTGAICGRIQETILTIYNWFTGNNLGDANIEPGTGIAGKTGILRRAVLSKTADYSSRLVLSAQELKVETVDDMMVDVEHAAIPLATAIADYKPFVLFNVKRFFEGEFGTLTKYPIMDKKTHNITYVDLEDPMIEFSDERIEEEMERFLHGYSDRFIPIKIPTNDGKDHYMVFKGKKDNRSMPNVDSIYNRYLTWVDVFYMACVEAVRDKTALITRFPIDSRFNQVPVKLVVSSTKKTEPFYVNGKYYKYYPSIKQEDIGTDTSNKFIDTLQFSNLLLKGFTADFDGDQCTVKGVYTKEANEELSNYITSKANYITGGGENIKFVDGDAIQAIFSLTRVLDKSLLTAKPKFKN